MNTPNNHISTDHKPRGKCSFCDESFTNSTLNGVAIWRYLQDNTHSKTVFNVCEKCITTLVDVLKFSRVYPPTLYPPI